MQSKFYRFFPENFIQMPSFSSQLSNVKYYSGIKIKLLFKDVKKPFFFSNKKNKTFIFKKINFFMYNI